MMLMGRNPANPLKLLRDTWSGENQLPQTTSKSVSEFLAELQTQIQEIHDFADEDAAVEQQRYTDQYTGRKKVAKNRHLDLIMLVLMH